MVMSATEPQQPTGPSHMLAGYVVERRSDIAVYEVSRIPSKWLFEQTRLRLR